MLSVKWRPFCLGLNELSVLERIPINVPQYFSIIIHEEYRLIFAFGKYQLYNNTLMLITWSHQSVTLEVIIVVC